MTIGRASRTESGWLASNPSVWRLIIRQVRGGPRVPLTRAIGVAERKKTDSHSHTERERVRLLQRHSWSGIAQHSFSHSFPLPQLGHRRRLAVSRRVSCACETFSFPDERRCSIIIIISIIVSSSSRSSCSEWSERSVANACVRAYHGLPVPVSRPRISPSALPLSSPWGRDMVRCGAVVICAFDAAVHKILVLALVFFVSSYLLS